MVFSPVAAGFVGLGASVGLRDSLNLVATAIMEVGPFVMEEQLAARKIMVPKTAIVEKWAALAATN